jgi:hypothetical protein
MTWETRTYDEDRLKAERDAALEALRPFARMGATYLVHGDHPDRVLVQRYGLEGEPERLKVSDCLSALKTWKEYRGEEEP